MWYVNEEAAKDLTEEERKRLYFLRDEQFTIDQMKTAKQALEDEGLTLKEFERWKLLEKLDEIKSILEHWDD